ncbi:MAG: glycine--tRNA ligase subunit beta, partial [Cohaesibacteraceae bacterium]|nr:glycine--tRNA ligase subunit beta [Cohaesibacteraceae bacterium]
MPDLLLEIFSEEIPARMQRRAAEDLKALVTDGLVKAGLTYEGAKSFCTPRRLALTVNGLTARSPDRKDERKGPRVGAPAKALEGFVKGSGLSSIDDAKIRTDPKKGDFYVAVIEQKGKNAQDIISILVPDVIAKFPWPKSMKWASKRMRWVRPLHSIVCTFGSDLEETEIINFSVEGINSSNQTRGHRFHSDGDVTVKRFEDYVAILEKNHVILDQQRRIDNIKADCESLAFAQGFELVNDA